MGPLDRAEAEEQAAMLSRLSSRVRQEAGLELNPDHTTKLPTVWIFRLLYLILGISSTVGILLLNFRFLPREEAKQLFVTREVFEGLQENTKATAEAVKAINSSMDQMRATMATLAARAEKDQIQDDRIRRNEETLAGLLRGAKP